MKAYIYDVHTVEGEHIRMTLTENEATKLYNKIDDDLGVTEEPEQNEWKLAADIPDNTIVIGKNTGVKFRREDGKTYFLGTNKTWLLSESFYLDEEQAVDGGFLRVGRSE